MQRWLVQWLLTTKPPQTFWGCDLAGGSLCSAPPGHGKRCPHPDSAPRTHTHPLGKWCAAELTLAFTGTSTSSQLCWSKLGTGEEKAAQLQIHQVWCGGVLYSSVCLLKGADPFCSLGLWTKSRAAASTVIRDTTERFTLPTTRRPLTLPYFQHQREDFPLLSPVYNVLSKFLGFNKAIDK